MALDNINFNYWIMQTIAMSLTAWVLPKLKITSIFGALLTVVALSFINAHVWDTLLFMSIPSSLSMQSLVLLITNAVIFWVLVKLLPGIEIEGILTALIAPIVFTVFSLLISHYAKDIDWVQLATLLFEKLQELKSSLQSGSGISN